jgi:hypothetical protein
MSAVTGKSLKAEALRCLAGGINTQKADAFLDLLLELAAASGSVTCTLANERVLRLEVRDTALLEVEIPLAKTKVRMLCARLAVRCGEWGGRKISPYGDLVEIQVPSTERFFKVCFENSTHAQAITVESIPANGAASTRKASPR